MKMAMKGFVTAETLPLRSYCNLMSPQSTRQMPEQIVFSLYKKLLWKSESGIEGKSERGNRCKRKSESEKNLSENKKAYWMLLWKSECVNRSKRKSESKQNIPEKKKA